MDAEHSVERLKRKLAVILASDVAGYSRLVSSSEDQTVARFRNAAQTFVELIKRHDGRVFNTAGDAILAEFDSAVNATRCAIDFQFVNNRENLSVAHERRLLFRIGLAVADVVVNDNMDLLGDGVNIAARLQTLAEPGGICASEDIKRYVATKLPLQFVDLGPCSLKNIDTPVRAFRIGLDAAAKIDPAAKLDPALKRDLAVGTKSRFADFARRKVLLSVGIAATAVLIAALFVLWPAEDSTRIAWPSGSAPQKFAAAVVPLITDGARAELADWAKRPDSKALAISDDGYYRAAVGLPDPESAKQDALRQCRTVSKHTCRIYAVGMDVVWPANLLPLPLASDVHAQPLDEPLIPAELPMLSDKVRREVDQIYTPLPEHKALTIDKSHRYHHTPARTSGAEAARLVVERCVAQRQFPCLLIAVDGQLTLQIPKLHRIIDIFMITTEQEMSPQDKQRIAEIYRRKEWRALVRGKSGRWYAIAGAPSESKAVDIAIESCSQTDTECKLHAIGNFRVADE